MSLRPLNLIIALFLLADCAAASGGQRDKRPSTPRPLSLAVEVIGSRYCAGDKGLGVLHLKLRLRYVNAGPEKLILYAGNNLFFQVFVAADGGATGPARYELKSTSARYVGRGPEKLEGSRPNGDFVTLPVGGAHETEVAVSLQVAPDGAPKSAGTIKPGEHRLMISTSTWYESKEVAERLRERWRRAGLLWSSPVSSKSVKFNSRPSGAQPCG